mmetsp:Transcript_36066/g.81037  ORF Transcript_36066/g.81037 Transcript_36066/m.81037 type:complete len:116 (+) Transcript_36066:224-571(+)
MPEVKVVKTLWGVDENISASLFEAILAEGYAGVEVIALAYSSRSAEEVLVEAANSAGLSVIFQIHTSGGYIDEETGEYVYIDSYDVQQHVDDLEIQIKRCEGNLLHWTILYYTES